MSKTVAQNRFDGARYWVVAGLVSVVLGAFCLMTLFALGWFPENTTLSLCLVLAVALTAYWAGRLNAGWARKAEDWDSALHTRRLRKSGGNK